MKEIVISAELFEKGMKKLEELRDGPPPKKQTYRGREATKAYEPIISRLTKRGYTREQINSALESVGVKIGLANLTRLLRDLAKEKRANQPITTGRTVKASSKNSSKPTNSSVDTENIDRPKLASAK